jgi:hypothetical protein
VLLICKVPPASPFTGNDKVGAPDAADRGPAQAIEQIAEGARGGG